MIVCLTANYLRRGAGGLCAADAGAFSAAARCCAAEAANLTALAEAPRELPEAPGAFLEP